MKIKLTLIAMASIVAACAQAGSGSSGTAEQEQPSLQAARERMVREVVNRAAVAGVQGHSRLSPGVLEALRVVPRHLFVPAAMRSAAYDNRPLPIGQGQTISQPYIVALMTDAVRPSRDHVVLEVGTGSGYQAAILARLVKQVDSIEIVEPLAREAAVRLRTLGFENVTVRQGDGYAGWPEHAPFDSIVVTAGAPHIPEPLVQQLKRGGRMVIPVDRSGGDQELMLMTKGADGRVRRRSLGPVAFVPLTGPGAAEGGGRK